MLQLNALAVLLFVFSLPAVSHAGTIYIWRDANGTRHYSDVCPPGEDCRVRETTSTSGYGWKKQWKSSSTDTTSSTGTDTSTTSTTSGTSADSGSTTTSGGTTTTSSGTTTISGGTTTTSGGTTTSSGGTETTSGNTTTTSSSGTTTTSSDTTTTTSSNTSTSSATTTSSTDTTTTTSGDTSTSSGTTTSTTSGSGQATLYWDPVAGAAGYRVYYGTSTSTLSPPYGSGLNVGNVTSYTVTGLDSGKRYYFNATTVDSTGNESIISDQVFKDIP